MEEQVVGPDPFPVDRMDAEERLSDLGRILAAGIRRMRGAEPESDVSAANPRDPRETLRKSDAH